MSLCLWLIAATVARADGYYTVTDLGSIGSVSQVGQDYVNAQTGASFPFVITQGTPLPASVYADRPGVYAQDGTINPTRDFFQMNVSSANSAGTVIGTVPSGGSVAIPWSTVTYGYAVFSPTTGQWLTGFIPLPTGTLEGPQGTVALSQNANMILVNSDAGAGSTALFNPATGTSTPLSQLVSPSFLAALDSAGSSAPLLGQAIDDRGDILASGLASDGLIHDYILTPPNVAPVPEPTTLAVLILGGAGLACRRWIGSRKKRRLGIAAANTNER